MVNYKINRHKRLYDLRIFSKPRDDRTHRRKINKERHACEILKQNARDYERNLFYSLGVWFPVSKCTNVLLAHLFAVNVAQYGFQNYANRNGKP